MRARDHSAYRLMREGARDPETLSRYLREGRGTHEAFRKGWSGVACMYPRGTIQTACWYAGRDARKESQ